MIKTAAAIFTELEKIGLKERKQQQNLSSRIETCFQKQKNLIAEAPTGVGKSLAYLIPAILLSLRTKKKIIISTSSKALQKQLVDEDLPLLRQVLSFEYALSLGSENYFCDSILSRSLQFGLFDSASELVTLGQIRALREKNPNATMLDCNFNIPDSLKQRICRDSHVCSAACHSRTLCAYSLAAKKQHAANIVVTNHHKTFHIIKNGSKNLDSVAAIVFDECHNVEETATAVFGESIASKDVVRTIKELSDQRSKKGVLNRLRLSSEERDTIARAVKSVVERMYDLSQLNNAEQDLMDEDRESLKNLQSSLVHLGNLLKNTKMDVLASYIGCVANYVNTIDSLLKTEEGYVYWKKISGRNWTFTVTPLSVSDLLRKKLYKKHKIMTVHLSATVAVRRKMRFYRSRTGIIDAEEIIVDSVFDYNKQAALYIPSDMPEPREKEYLPAAINQIGKLISHFQGKTLILFTSYSALNESYEILAARFEDFVFLRQGDIGTNALINKFKEINKAVLLGAGTCWEGINIPGPALQCVIVMKLPFGVPSDPVAVAHEKELRRRGQLPFWAYQIPRALIRFRQGFGRLIRTESDTGLFAVLDSRILKKKYGKIFVKSLPDCPLINDSGAFPVRELSRDGKGAD